MLLRKPKIVLKLWSSFFLFFFVLHSAGTKKPPILVDGEAVYHDLAEMVDYLDASYQKSLQPKDKETHSVGMELFIALSK